MMLWFVYEERRRWRCRGGHHLRANVKFGGVAVGVGKSAVVPVGWPW